MSHVGIQGPYTNSLCFFFPIPQLLEYEPRSGEQVPLLLKMKRSKLALNKAIESGDTDLGEQILGEGQAGTPKLKSGPRLKSLLPTLLLPVLLSHSVHGVAAPEE